MNFLKRIFQTPLLRKKILFVIFALTIFRVAAHITVPGVDISALQNLFAENELLGAFSILTGGSLENFSIVLMGLTPYINASIIMQLMTVVIPKLEELSKEGEQGRNKINSWTRWLAFPLAFLQSYGMILLLNKSAGGALIPNISDLSVILPIMITVSAGTMFLMWLGEIMTEKGIGNGISLLIFASIVAGIPPVLGQTLGIAQFDHTKIIPFVLVLAVTVALTIIVVLVTEGARQIPVNYGSRAGSRGAASALPDSGESSRNDSDYFFGFARHFPDDRRGIFERFGESGAEIRGGVGAREFERRLAGTFLCHFVRTFYRRIHLFLCFDHFRSGESRGKYPKTRRFRAGYSPGAGDGGIFGASFESVEFVGRAVFVFRRSFANFAHDLFLETILRLGATFDFRRRIDHRRRRRFGFNSANQRAIDHARLR